jgi:hypothetical protein
VRAAPQSARAQDGAAVALRDPDGQLLRFTAT